MTPVDHLHRFYWWLRSLPAWLNVAVLVALACGVLWYVGFFGRVAEWWDHRQDAAFDKADTEKAAENEALRTDNERLRKENAAQAEEIAASKAREDVYRKDADRHGGRGAEIDAEIEKQENEMRNRGEPAVVDADAVLQRLRERKATGRH